MDNWNPILAETHVKHVPFWRVLAGYALLVAAVLAGTWVAAVIFLSLERTVKVKTAFIALLALAGCASMSDTKVDGWPALEIVEHYVAHADMRNRCHMYVGFGSAPEACAEFSFSAARCDIWFSADFPPASFVVAHERQHCLGFDHVGGTSMKAMLAQHRGAL